MSIGIGNEHEVLPLQVVLGFNEVLRVTANGQFVWNPDADRMIEEGDFSSSPALPHILRALRKREWVGLTDEEAKEVWKQLNYDFNHGKFAADDTERHVIVEFYRAIEQTLKEKNNAA
jgi:hypothetical protein